MDATATFEAERDRLAAIAYRMLGSASDADDIVQDTWLRWSAADHDTVINPAAFLTTITSRLALDRLKSAQHRRESYVGAWLPEPIATATGSNPESAVVMEESIMLGFLTVLERLGPVERAVFVLREVFDLDYGEVAGIVGRSEPNCRQIARRAREHVRAERPRVAPDHDRDRRLLDAFVMALASGDSHGLTELLHDDVVLISDGGPKVRAARRPIIGSMKVTRFLAGIVKNAPAGEARLDYVHTNGQVALYVALEGQAPSLFTLEPDTSGDKVRRVFVLRNPDKLRHVTSSPAD